MNIDTHWHVIVPEMTRGAAAGGPSHAPAARAGSPSGRTSTAAPDGGPQTGDDAWRPSVRWQGEEQIVEFRGRTVKSALKEFVRIDRILEEAETMQIDHVLLSPWVNLLPDRLEAREALDVCRLQNEGLSAMARSHPGRVSALASVPMQEPELAARELAEAMKLPGVRGIEVAASVRGTYLGDDRFLPFWEAAEAAGAVVFVHPTTRGFDLPVFNDYYLWNTVGNPVETTVTAAHMILSGVLERFPRLVVLLAHGGGGVLALRGRLRHAVSFQPQAKSRMKGSLDESLARLYFDTVTHDAELLRQLIDYAGPDHVLLGSDVPFDMGTFHAVEEVKALALSTADEKNVLGGNAARLLGIEKGIQ